jgi:hypothetical protein
LQINFEVPVETLTTDPSKAFYDLYGSKKKKGEKGDCAKANLFYLGYLNPDLLVLFLFGL